jgi:hypothetical protein
MFNERVVGKVVWDVELQPVFDSYGLLHHVAHGVGDQMQHKHDGVVLDGCWEGDLG